MEVSFETNFLNDDIIEDSSLLNKKLIRNIQTIRGMKLDENTTKNLIEKALIEYDLLMSKHLNVIKIRNNFTEEFTRVMKSYTHINAINTDDLTYKSVSKIWSSISILLSSIRGEAEFLTENQIIHLEIYEKRLIGLEEVVTRADSENKLNYNVSYQFHYLSQDACGLFRKVFSNTLEDLKKLSEIDSAILKQIEKT